MKVLVKQAKINCVTSPFHGQVKDILIVDGKIAGIEDAIKDEAATKIDKPGLQVSTGWVDVFAHFADPGQEHKETLLSGGAAAAAGGFTDVFILPNTYPTTNTRSQVEYLKQKATGLPVNIHPIGNISKNAEGKELAEMYDMHAGGAVAFSDGKNAVQSAGMILKALQYVKAVDSILIQLPEDRSIGGNGLMNEGIMSTQLGMPGKPAIAEEIMIAREIELMKHTSSRLHITGVSTAKGIQLIKVAKQAGLRISCSVSPYHLYFNDSALIDYDTNLKVNPPLRTGEDQLALQLALAEGLVDCIASHHMPEHWDDKTCEFEYAKDGMITLESLFGAMNTGKNLDMLITALTENPRTIFQLPSQQIAVGKNACLTFFNPDTKYVFEEKHIHSLSRNSAFIGKPLKGLVYGIFNNNKLVVNENT